MFAIAALPAPPPHLVKEPEWLADPPRFRSQFVAGKPGQPCRSMSVIEVGQFRSLCHSGSLCVTAFRCVSLSLCLSVSLCLCLCLSLSLSLSLSPSLSH